MCSSLLTNNSLVALQIVVAERSLQVVQLVQFAFKLVERPLFTQHFAHGVLEVLIAMQLPGNAFGEDRPRYRRRVLLIHARVIHALEHAIDVVDDGTTSAVRLELDL